MATNFFDLPPRPPKPDVMEVADPPIPDILEQAIATLMPGKTMSGSFEIMDELVDQTSGSYGAVIDAIIVRGRKLGATVNIEIEPQVRYRTFVDKDHIITFLNVTVNWSK